MNKFADKNWFVNECYGPSDGPYTFDEACEFAQRDSANESTSRNVTHRNAKRPTVIYWHGCRYDGEPPGKLLLAFKRIEQVQYEGYGAGNEWKVIAQIIARVIPDEEQS